MHDNLLPVVKIRRRRFQGYGSCGRMQQRVTPGRLPHFHRHSHRPGPARWAWFCPWAGWRPCEVRGRVLDHRRRRCSAKTPTPFAQPSPNLHQAVPPAVFCGARCALEAPGWPLAGPGLHGRAALGRRSPQGARFEIPAPGFRPENADGIHEDASSSRHPNGSGHDYVSTSFTGVVRSHFGVSEHDVLFARGPARAARFGGSRSHARLHAIIYSP